MRYLIGLLILLILVPAVAEMFDPPEAPDPPPAPAPAPPAPKPPAPKPKPPCPGPRP